MRALYEIFLSRDDGRCDKWHHYFHIYERHLAKFRNTAVRYLEIGVQRGGSLSIMREYFGAEAKITGIDVDPLCANLEKEGSKIFIGDQADATFLQRVASDSGPFDVVIDDGGHTPHQQIVSFINLWPHIRVGGVYIVEDLHATFWPSYQQSGFGINFYDFAKGLTDKLSLWHLDPRSTERYRIPPEQRGQALTIQNFATHQIHCIAFYDSMVVFERADITEPQAEVR
jgi:hypothetical protein